MGKLNQFQIDLHQSIYYTGQWLQGQVLLNLREPMKMRGIKLELYGGANVHWSERHTTGTGKSRRTHTTHYNANEVYFKSNIVLYGNSGGMFSESTEHPAGVFTYPFQFQLPVYLPSSFEHEIGHVRYYTRCVIDRPWKFDHKTKQPFTITCNLDLNRMPNMLSSPQGQDSKTLCCLCCASGPLDVMVRIDRKGYVPGENILINAEINNHTSRKIHSIKAQLIQTMSFITPRKTRTQTAVVAVTKRGELAGDDSDTWSAVPLHIPPVPPSELTGCNIIDICYTLLFTVEPSGPAFKLKIPLELVIGTIPLQTYFDDYTAAAQAAYTNPAISPPPTAYTNPSAPPMPVAPTAPSSGPPPPPPGAPPGAPPPSYQASVFGKTDFTDDGDNEHTMGETSYAPVYPYYNWNQAAYSLPEQPQEKDG